MSSSSLKENLSLGTFTVFVVAVGAYFFFAATDGRYGLYQKGKIEAREAELQILLDSLQTTRIESENRVKRLSDDFLDLDLLDERARKTLGFARMDEIIIR